MKIEVTAEFCRGTKRSRKRGLDLDLLDAAVTAIVNQNRDELRRLADHPLRHGKLGQRELHIDGSGDWLLRYRILGDRVVLLLLATGTHREVLNIE